MVTKGKRSKRYPVEQEATQSYYESDSYDESDDSEEEDTMSITNICNSEPSELLSRIVRGKSKQPISPVVMLAARESNLSGRGRFMASENRHISRQLLPIYGPKKIDKISNCPAHAYISQFSSDASILFSGFQMTIRTSYGQYRAGKLRIYDVDNGWKLQKEIKAKSMLSTITAASLSPDNRYMIYSSLSPLIHIVDVNSEATDYNVDDTDETSEFHQSISMNPVKNDYQIFSVKFSSDGREFVAASNDKSIHVYNLLSGHLSTLDKAHNSHVNTACFADESGQILFSGSDDGLVKVWDRRDNTEQAAGVLVGHMEGITFIDNRGDYRHLISNGKDQVIKLWDLRKMVATAAGINRQRMYNFDYTWENYPRRAFNKHPDDLSVATFSGHTIKHTLIRCYFSPAYSTGQRYIYTGSSDHCVYIFDVVTGAQVGQLEYHRGVVRDCSWHPNLPMLVTSSWDGRIARWELPEDKSENSAEFFQ